MKYIIDKIDELETNSKAKNTIEYKGYRWLYEVLAA